MFDETCLLFNDEIMALYIAMAICLLTVNKRPLLASLALTTGLSLKAGVMLLVPAFLGSIQYGWGTWKLLASIIIIIGFQVLVAGSNRVSSLGGRFNLCLETLDALVAG